MAGEGSGNNKGNGRENIDAFEWGEFLKWTRSFFAKRRAEGKEFEPFVAEDIVAVAAASNTLNQIGRQGTTADPAALSKDQKLSAQPIVERYLEECVVSGALTKEGDSYRATPDTGATLFWNYDIDTE